jgi:hypothetical protein
MRDQREFRLNSRRIGVVIAVLMVLGLLLLSGRGGGARIGNRIEVYGTVELDGERLKSGRIHFLPDAENGGAGPATLARIVGGRYRIPSADGPAPSTYKIRIKTGDPPEFNRSQSASQEPPQPRMTYDFTRSLSESAREQNFTLTPDAISSPRQDGSQPHGRSDRKRPARAKP